MPSILFYGVSIAVISVIIEDSLSDKSTDENSLYKKLIEIGIGVGTISLIIRFLPTIAEKIKLL